MISKARIKRKMKLVNILISIPTFLMIFEITFYLTDHIEVINFNSFLYGFLISTFNISLGLLSIKLGLYKSDFIFLIVVFGGLILRFFLILALILLTLKFLFVRLNSFIFITFIFYFYYLIIEVYILSQKKNIKIKSYND
jgi:hypothetical protein